MPTRIPQLIIYNEWVTAGRSKMWTAENSHDEHVVPLSALIRFSCEMFQKNCDIDTVAGFLAKYLKVVKIHEEEARRLDSGNLKSNMPTGWEVGNSVFARLEELQIHWELGQ